MAQYIDKDALVAEIEKLISNGKFKCQQSQENNDHISYTAWSEHIVTCGKILSFLNSLEVKEVKNTELLKVRGYLVRDKDDYTAIYAEKPHRGKTEWVDGNDSCLMTINDARLVPDIEFEDKPVELEVALKRLNTGE